MNQPRLRWLLLVLTLLTFFFLLGSRSLNEPDEGRYAVIAQEMLETGDWLVPHFWYVPHLDKPPLTYWSVALSLSVFGHNEWAVRLPSALAALGCVDYVTVFDEADPCPLLQELRPDVLFKGGDYPIEEVVGREIVEGYGGRVYVMPVVVDASSTGLIRHIRELAVAS